MCRCRRSWRQDRLQDLQGELRFKLGSFSILNQSLFKRHIEALFRFARPWEPCQISFGAPLVGRDATSKRHNQNPSRALQSTEKGFDMSWFLELQCLHLAHNR